MGIEIEDRPPDQRGRRRAENDWHEDDGLEGSRPSDPLGEDGEHQTEERDDEGEDHHPDQVVAERDQDAGAGKDHLVVVEPDVAGRTLVKNAIPKGHDDRIDRDGQQPDRRRREEEQRTELVAPAGAAGGPAQPPPPAGRPVVASAFNVAAGAPAGVETPTARKAGWPRPSDRAAILIRTFCRRSYPAGSWRE